jgi:hypothetical protein
MTSSSSSSLLKSQIRPAGLLACLLICGGLYGAFCGSAWAQNAASSSISLPTDLRIQGAGWWPRNSDAPRDAYAGTAVCAKCHSDKASAQSATAMAHASVLAAESEVLRRHPNLAFNLGPYAYKLESAGDKNVMSIGKDSDTRSQNLLWGIGFGRMGQTYLYRQNGDFYESHLSFFSAIDGLDITAGHERSVPKGVDEALGMRQPPGEIERCFSCHTTASKAKSEFNPDHAFAGVTCEGCHGPGAAHVASINSQQGVGSIFNPSLLPPVDAVDFCGSCHRTWQDVVGSGLTGVGTFNVRFAPYRLENSKCWQKTQSGLLTCAACHDPHQPLVHDVASYDSRCLQCHAPKSRGSSIVGIHAKACPVSAKNCVSCHMPKVQPPNLHSDFTDHWIRVVKRGAPYPE